MRFLGAVIATVLASSLGTLVACSAHDKDESVPTAQAVQGASVQIALLDANGTRIGDASGVLLAPRLVLTSGHAISGKYKWQVTSADGKQQVLGSRGMTYDWMTYDSQKAHPRRHDIGVIHLDAPITLDAYPRLVGEKAIDNMQATRIRGTGASFEKLPIQLTKVPSAPHSLLGQLSPGETLDTGGAVYDERGIIGIVSGRGMTTGKLYVARTDQLSSWLSDKVACAGGAATRTYAAPVEDKTKAACDDAGNPLSSSGSPGGSNPSSSGTPGGSGGNDGSCSGNNNGHCSGAACGNGGSNPNHPQGDDDDDSTGGPNGSSSGGTGSGSGTGVGSSGSNGNQTPSTTSGGPSTSSGGTDTTNPTGGSNPNQPQGGQSSGQTGSGSGSGTGVGSSGTSGNQGSSSGSTDIGSSSGSSGSSSGGGHTGGSGGTGANDDGEACQGSTDNPETCPPEPDGCSGAACGGGLPDDLIEYGSCACGGGASDGDLHVH